MTKIDFSGTPQTPGLHFVSAIIFRKYADKLDAAIAAREVMIREGGYYQTVKLVQRVRKCDKVVGIGRYEEGRVVWEWRP